MPCDTNWTRQQATEAETALRALAEEIAAGTKVIRRNALTGQYSITGWARSEAARLGWCEGCALRVIQAKGWAQQAVQQAGINKRGFVVTSHNGHKH